MRHFSGLVARVVIAAVAAAGCADSSPSSPQMRATASATGKSVSDVIETDGIATLAWQRTARDLVVKYRFDPLAATRVYALVSTARHAAVLDASLGGGRREYEAERGAAAGASAAMLSFFFAAEAAALDDLVRAQGEAGPGQPHPHFAIGEITGRAAAARAIERARVDGFDDVWTGTIPVGPEFWRSTGSPPAKPLLGLMRPYYLSEGSQFRPGPPPAYLSAEWAAALAEVSEISATRTPEQLLLAQFWALRAGTVTTQGYWDEQATLLIQAAGLGELETASILAVLDAAAADAAIACWDAKYTYWFLRPSHANTSITLPIGLPSHPSYPSGHSCISGSSSELLGRLFPDAAARLAALAVEAGRSRVYAGIHYQFDADVGLALGRRVGQFVFDKAVERGLFPSAR